MRLGFRWIGGLLVMVVWLVACSESRYTKLVKSEMASGVRHERLFLEFRFGDKRSEFFAKGWAINKSGKIKQGPGNQSVEWVLNPTDSMSSPLRVLFYPKFTEEDRLHVMDMTFDYLAWAPWSPRYMSDSLLVAVQDTLMSWYGGNEFFQMELEKGPKQLWVKVDGNRQITLFKKDDQFVVGKIEDLAVKYEDELLIK